MPGRALGFERAPWPPEGKVSLFSAELAAGLCPAYDFGYHDGGVLLPALC